MAGKIAMGLPAPKTAANGKNMAFGGVVIDSARLVLLRRPKGDYDDYVWTFPKGRPDTGESAEQTALREVREETGYTARIVAKLPGAFEGGTSVTEFFIMEPVGDPGAFDKETAAVRWATLDEAVDLIGLTTNVSGKPRDLAVLLALQTALESTERLHSDVRDVVGPTDGDNPPWLNQITVVDGIIRTFGNEFLKRVSAVEGRGADKQAMLDWLDYECNRLGWLFTGYEPGEKREDFKRGPWNTPGQIGHFVRLRIMIDGEQRKAVRDAFALHAKELLDEVNLNEGKPVEEWGWKLDALIESLAYALLGLPFNVEGYEDIDPAKDGPKPPT